MKKPAVKILPPVPRVPAPPTRALPAGAILILAALLLPLPSCKGPAGETGKTDRQVPAETRPLRMGFMICDSVEDTRRRFEPLTRHVSQVTGLPIEPVYLNTFDVPEAYERGELDITHTNSLLYIMMREKGLEPLAGEKRGSMGTMAAGGIAVRADSDIETLADLKGRSMVFGPMMSPTGYLAQYELLLNAGIDPEVDLDFYAIPWGAYKHEKVVYGVWMGAYDAAAVPLLDLEIMVAQRKIGGDDLRIIARNDAVPYCVFGVSPSVPEETRNAVRSALMNLTGDVTVPVGEEVVAVLRAAEVDGFVPIRDTDFDRLREMAKKTNMPPYQEY